MVRTTQGWEFAYSLIDELFAQKTDDNIAQPWDHVFKKENCK